MVDRADKIVSAGALTGCRTLMRTTENSNLGQRTWRGEAWLLRRPLGCKGPKKVKRGKEGKKARGAIRK